MGQQQLLLLVVGIVIVALAIAVGVDSYLTNKVQSQQDEFALEAMEIATEVLAWQRRHPSMGGNQGNSDLSSLDLNDLGRDVTSQTGSVSYHDMDSRRLIIDASNSAAPVIQVHSLPLEEGKQSYEVALWAEDVNCWSFRIQKYDGSSWSLISGDISNPNSDACGW